MRSENVFVPSRRRLSPQHFSSLPSIPQETPAASRIFVNRYRDLFGPGIERPETPDVEQVFGFTGFKRFDV